MPQMPTFQVMQMPDNGQKALSIDQIWVCPDCGCFAQPHEQKWSCEAHPDRPAELKHITVTDPYEAVTFNKATVRPVHDPRVAHWKRNYAANASIIKNSVYDLPQSDVVYLVGCGPSLEVNGHWLRHVSNGTIITLNDALNWVPNADYFLCMDHVFQNTRGNAKTTAVLAPTVRNELARLPWKDVRWMRSSATGTEPFETIHKRHPDLWLYDEGLNCTFTAYQFIAQILNPKCLVLVGLDCGFSPDRERVGKALSWNDKDQYVVVPDAFGRPTLCNGLYSRVINFTVAMLSWFQKHGCQVVNANAGGALPTQIGIQSVETVAPMQPLPDVIRADNERKR
jgi:hypothetical protein